jgi:hypothetical protein
MRSVGADEAGLAGRWLREQVAAHIARRQTHRAKARDHDVREVLADALALRQCLDRGRVDLGAFRLVVEVAVHALRQVHRDVEGRPAGHEAGPCIGREVVVTRHVRRRKDKVRGGIEGRALAVDEALADRLPSQVACHGRREHGGLRIDHAFSDDDQFVVRRIERKKCACVAVQIRQLAALRRLGRDAQRVAHEPLRRGGERLQMRKMLRRLDGRRVVVTGFVGDVQQHVWLRCVPARLRRSEAIRTSG